LGLIEQALDPGQNGLAAPEEQAAVAASNGRAGTAIGADRQAVRRAPGAAARAWQRDDRLSDFRRGADGSVVLAWDSSDGVMGRVGLGDTGAADAVGTIDRGAHTGHRARGGHQLLTAASFATRRTSADCAGNQVVCGRSN